MLSTVDWPEETSSESQTVGYNTDAMTTSSESSSTTPISLAPYKAVLASIGYLGTFTNALVLLGFWLSDRSKLTSSSIHIINHTALELSTFTMPYHAFTTVIFLTYIVPTMIMSAILDVSSVAIFLTSMRPHLFIRPLGYLLV